MHFSMMIGHGFGNVAIEIAIGAFGSAKGPVDIDPKTAVAPISRKNTPRKIFETVCTVAYTVFSSRGISANVTS